MAKKRKRTAKAAKTTKASAKQKAAKKKSVKKKTAKKKTAKKKTAVAKILRKRVPAKKSKSGANRLAKTPVKKPAAMTTAKTAAGGKPVAPPPESLSHKIANAVGAVVDVFTDAERLHHKLEPGISNEPE